MQRAFWTPPTDTVNAADALFLKGDKSFFLASHTFPLNTLPKRVCLFPARHVDSLSRTYE